MNADRSGGAYPSRPPARHLDLGFKLLDNNRLPRNPTRDEFETIGKLFPHHFGTGILGPFLVISVRELPPKPWPVSVAGLPLFLTTKMADIPWNIGKPGKIRHRVLEYLNATENATRLLYDHVIAFFEEQGIYIWEVVWMVGCWRIRVPNTTDIAVLPGYICQAAAFYLFSEGYEYLNRASRLKDPTQASFDESAYSPLRPGVAVTSASFTSTSGIMVENAQAQTFMTVASHSFPVSEVNVYQPKQNDNIGQVDYRIQEADIALVRLRPELEFENRTFSNEADPNGVALKGIRDPFELKRFDVLSMDTSFTGLVDAQFLGVSLYRLPSDAQEECCWVTQLWNWEGQENTLPNDGCCGSVIWDTEGYAVGFFRFVMADSPGIGIGVAAQELVTRGYTLYGA